MMLYYSNKFVYEQYIKYASILLLMYTYTGCLLWIININNRNKKQTFHFWYEHVPQWLEGQYFDILLVLKR